MQAEIFKEISRQYAGIIGRRDNVEIRFRPGHMAFTDGKIITVPDLPYGSTLTERQATVFGGYLDHEAAHVRETNFEEVKIAAADRLVKQVSNVIEDIRIERIQIKRYPGMQYYLDALCHEVDNLPHENCQTNLIWSAFYKECWESYRGVKTPIQVTLRSLGLGEVEDLLREIPKLTNTRDTRKLAEQVVKLLRQKKQQAEATLQSYQPVPNPLVGMKIGAGDVSDRDQKNENESEPKGEEAEEEMGEAGADGDVDQRETAQDEGELLNDGHDQEESKKEEGFGKNVEESQGGQGAVTKEVAEALEDLEDFAQEDEKREAFVLLLIEKSEEELKAEQEVEMGQGKEIYPPLNPDKDKLMVRPTGGDSRAKMVVPESTSRLQREMLRIFQSRDKRAWTRDQEEGDLDDDALFSTRTGNKRIYQTKRERRSINTAVEVVLDCSGSMNSNLVRMATAILAESLNAIPRLKFEVVGFKSVGGGRYEENDVQRKKNAKIGRIDIMEVALFKGFEETLGMAKKYFERIQCGGGTPLGDAYAVGMENLLKRKEQKKILWVVTDGDPSFSVVNMEHNDHLLMAKIKNQCETYGIITVGLGVGLPLERLKKYFKHAEVTNAHGMVMSMLKLAEQLV